MVTTIAWLNSDFDEFAKSFLELSTGIVSKQIMCSEYYEKNVYTTFIYYFD